MADITQYYSILRLSPDATQEQVKHAYRELAKQWHPDQVAPNSEEHRVAHEKLKEINAAYAFLRSYQPSPPPARFCRDSTSKSRAGAEALETHVRGIERLYLEAEEKRRRERNGLCSECGHSLTMVDRLLGRISHGRCRG